MFESFHGRLYRTLIDPVLSGFYPVIISNIEQDDNVIDIACGTGSLALALSMKASSVTGIDISEPMIGMAAKSAMKMKSENVKFLLRDAADLSVFADREFNISSISMAIHQFEPELAISILSSMKRISSKIIITDYNFPLPHSLSGTLAFAAERIAGGEHYRNFRVYTNNGGISYYIRRSGLSVSTQTVAGNGVFQISVCI